MKKWRSGILIVFCLLAVSCTVTKRHYRKGFHVQWHHSLPERVGSGDEAALTPVSRGDQELLDTLHDLALAPPALLQVEDPAFKSRPFSDIVQQESKQPFLAQVPSGSKQKVVDNFHLQRPVFAPAHPYLFSTGVEVPGKQEADHSLLFGILALSFFVLLFFPAMIFGVQAIESGRQARERNHDRDAQVTKRARIGTLLGQIALWLVFAVLAGSFIGLVCGFFVVYTSAEAAILALTLLCIGAFLVGILLALMTWVLIRYVF